MVIQPECLRGRILYGSSWFISIQTRSRTYQPGSRPLYIEPYHAGSVLGNSAEAENTSSIPVTAVSGNSGLSLSHPRALSPRVSFRKGANLSLQCMLDFAAL